MIAEHQPKIFPKDVFEVRFSTVAEGNMMHGPDFDPADVSRRRRNFLEEKHGYPLDKVHLLKVTYDTRDFRRYGHASELTQSLTREHSYVTPAFDALVHDRPGEAIAVPAADCGVMAALAIEKANGIPTGKYTFMMSHLGRHSILQNGAHDSVKYLAEEAGVDISDLLVYVGPTAGADNYPIEKLGGIGMQEAIGNQLLGAGLRRGQIEMSPLDTTTDENLYSNSEALKGRREKHGRQLVFAALRERQ